MSGFAGISVDESIVRRAQRGDARAHEVVYRAFSPAVFTLARRLLKSPQLAEDMLQETFIEVMRSLPRYRGDAALGTWIRRIAVSKCLMHLRTAWNQRAEILPDGAEPVDEGVAVAEQVGTRLDLQTALGMLPETGRVVVWLHDVEGYTHREIAMAMQKTESFSKSQLARAHQRLRMMLAEDDTADSPLVAEAVSGDCT